MTTTLCHVNPHGTRTYMGTLTDGAPLHETLAACALRQGIQAATFDLLGGLHTLELTAYDFTTQARLVPLTFSGALEIVAGHGTISLLDNAPHVHLHVVVAYRDAAAPTGITLVGGHAAHATAFAVEFTLHAYDGPGVRRAPHAGTGLQLWHLEAL
jgi:predicted DNA-binding protein with PD1-like motif